MAPQEDSYEKELDAYFVDRLRLANDKEQRAGLLKQRFKVRFFKFIALPSNCSLAPWPWHRGRDQTGL
jgi:hypothetical protein